jgi:hypothetical protein
MAEAGSRIDKDTAVGLTAAVILVAAMAGVFLYERAQFQEYQVTWEPSSVQDLEDSRTLAGGESETYSVTATTTGMARFRLELTWTDGNGEADTFAVDVESPGGTTIQETAASSPIEVSTDVNPEPNATTVSARSADEARQQANETVTSTAGQGNWTATVTLEDAPGTEGTGGVAGQEDGANEYDVAIAVDRWMPQVAAQG